MSDAAAPLTQPPARMSPPSRLAIALLRAYQGAASGRVSPCRFYPSCSNYAVEAFTVHGFWHGLALTARRLLRCRPFGPHGVDLVPIPVHAEHQQHHHGRGRPC
jgi:putative membrane protein insertion efficiency factor